MPITDPVASTMSNVIDLSEVFQREQADNVRPFVFIRRWPITPNRTKLEFCSVSKASVEYEIAFRTTHVESLGSGGEAHFIGPYKEDNIWKAKGYVVVYPDV